MTKFLLVLVMGFPFLAQAAPLDTEISSLTTVTSELETDVPGAFQRLKDETNLSKGVVLVGNVLSASAGNTIAVDFTLLPGTFSPTSIQAMIISPPGFTLENVVAGPAATAAQKSIDFSSGTFLVSGLNQEIIHQGVIATATFNLSPTLFKQPCSIGLIDPVASDKNGSAIPISVESGIVEIH